MKFDSTSVICVSRCNYKNELHIENHCHNFYHFLYITGGGGSILVDGKANEVTDNDVFLFQPGVYHEITANVADPMRAIELKFITEDAGLIDGIKRLPVRFSNKSAQIKSMFCNLVAEALDKQPFYKDRITLQTIELLLLLFRLHIVATCRSDEPDMKLPIDGNDTRHELADRLLKYIRKHFNRKITLEELSGEFNINKHYLCRVFSKALGISPIRYVNNLRLEKTKDLLVESELSITEISEAVGFNSIHYLSRFFTHKEGIAPIDYRQRSKDNFNIDVEEKYKIVDFKI